MLGVAGAPLLGRCSHELQSTPEFLGHVRMPHPWGGFGPVIDLDGYGVVEQKQSKLHNVLGGVDSAPVSDGVAYQLGDDESGRLVQVALAPALQGLRDC